MLALQSQYRVRGVVRWVRCYMMIMGCCRLIANELRELSTWPPEFLLETGASTEESSITLKFIRLGISSRVQH